MKAHFCITVRFLQPFSHGRGDGGEPEWPPSPLRIFQALVAAAAGRWNERMQLSYAVPALEWLAKQGEPMIVAAVGVRSEVKYRLYVPDNVADKVAKSWSAGREGSIADYRTEKDVRPIHLGSDAVHYLYPVADDSFEKHRETLTAAARCITHLGWGVDMVAGDACVHSDDDVAQLSGERWSPTPDRSKTVLRVPVEGTLAALLDKHTAFLSRVSDHGFKPVQPLTRFATVGYRRHTDPNGRAYAAFSILKTDASGFRPFDALRNTHVVAAMVRHAAAQAAEAAGWPRQRIGTFIHGHAPDGNGRARSEDGEPRFGYVPLPSIEVRRTAGGQGVRVVTDIRRVLIVGRPSEIGWVRRALSGQELTNEKTQAPAALLSMLPASDRGLRPYVGTAASWATVTPMVLPGYDDPGHLRRRLSEPISADEQARLLGRMNARVDGLLRKAIVQAGFSEELAHCAEIDWRAAGFLSGVDLASRYRVSEYLRRFARYHVRICWRDAAGNPIRISGPIVIGGGRFNGFGLFAALDV